MTNLAKNALSSIENSHHMPHVCATAIRSILLCDKILITYFLLFFKSIPKKEISFFLRVNKNIIIKSNL